MSEPQSPRSRVEEVRGWVQDLLGAPLPVLITELRCTKSECPTVETVIALLAKGVQRRWSIPRPLGELERRDVERALRDHPAGGAGDPHARGDGGSR